MKTLKDVWESKGMKPEQVAAQAGISLTTLWHLQWRKRRVGWQIVASVCDAVGITMNDFRELDACPKGPIYNKKSRSK